MKMEKTFYVLECGIEGCRAEFWLNDVPVGLRSKETGVFLGAPVNPLMVDGVNELSILVNPGPSPASALAGVDGRTRFVPDRARAFARICRYPAGAMVGGPDGKELLSVEWSSTGETLEVFPKVVTGRHDLGGLFGPWRWQTAQGLKLDEAARKEITETLEELRVSLDQGDAGPFTGLSGARAEDMEEAFSMEKGEKAGQIRRIMIKEFSRPWWGMEPLDAAGLEPRLCGGNRLVEILLKDWQPALREKPGPDGGAGYYDMIMAKMEDGWKIVR